MEKVLSILVKAMIKEFAVSSAEELLIILAQKGIHITIQVASDLYYNWQWQNRTQIEYTPVKNDLTQIKTKEDLKKDKTKYYC